MFIMLVMHHCRCSTWKKNMQIYKCSKRDHVLNTLLVTVVLVLMVVRNLFQTIHLVELDALIWFRYQMTVYRCNLKTVCCPLTSDHLTKSISQWILLVAELSDNAGYGYFPEHLFAMIALYWRNVKVWGGSTVVLLVMEIGTFFRKNPHDLGNSTWEKTFQK